MAHNAEDIIMKNMFDLMKGGALMFFGINKNIVAPTRTEQTQLTVQTNTIDSSYLLEDGSIIHLEFQTTKSQDDLYRFMVSAAVLANKEKKPVHTIVIYSAEIDSAPDSIDLGSLYYKVGNHYMIEFDGDLIYNGIVGKISKGERLTKNDIMSFALHPLMKSKDDKFTRFLNCVGLMKNIDDKTEYEQIKAMILLMAEKFLSDDELKIIKEQMSGMRIGEMFKTDKAIEIARKLINQGNSLESIADATGLDIEKLEELKAEVENDVA